MHSEQCLVVQDVAAIGGLKHYRDLSPGLLLEIPEGDPAADHRQDRLDILDLICRYREIVAVEHDEIGKLARLDRAEVVLLENEKRVLPRMGDQCILAADCLS